MANWKSVSARVAAYAVKVLGKNAPVVDVEDVSAEAIARAFEAVGDATTREVVDEALRCVRNLASSRRRRRRKGRLIFVPDTSGVHGEGQDPDAAIDRNAILAVLAGELVDDEEARAVFDAVLAGVESREELAETLGLTKAEVHNAQRRLYRRARHVFAEAFGDCWPLW